MDEPQRLLMRCARAGDNAGVDVALQRGARVDLLDKDSSGGNGGGRAALHHAAAAGHLDVVNLLLDFKANVNIRSKMAGDHGATPLHLSAAGGHIEVLEHLLRAHADIEAADDKGKRAVHWAASKGQQRVLQVLKAHGANLQARAHGGATLLHFAAADGDLSLVKWVVASGVKCQAKDKNNRVAKELAKSRGHSDVYRYLKDHSPKKGSLFQLMTSPLRSSGRNSKRHKNRQPGSGGWQEEGPDIPYTLDIPQETDVEPMTLATMGVRSTGSNMAAHGSVSQDSTDSRQVNSSKMTFEAASSSDKTDYGAKMSSDKMDKERKLSLDKTDYGAKMSSDKMDRERKLSSDKTDYERKLSSDKMLSEPSMSSYKTELKSGSLDSAGKTEKAPAVHLQTCEPAPQPSSVSASASMTYGSVGRDVTHSLPLLPSPHRSSLGSAYGRESKRSSLPRSFSLSRKSARKAHVRELTEIKGVLEDTLRSKEEQISYLRSQLTQLEHEKVEMSEQVKELQQCQHLQSELQQRHQAITKQNAEYEMMIEHLERRQEEFLQVDSAKSDAIAVCDSHIQELTRIVGENREQLSRYQRQQEEKEKELLALDASHKQTIDTLKANVDRLTAMLRKSDVNHVKRQPGGMEVGEDVLDEDGNILVRSVDDLQKNLSKMSKRVEEYEKFNSCFKEQLEAKERELEEREAQHQELEYSLREEVERLRAWKTQQQEQVHVREKLISDLNKNVEEKSITIKDYERLISSLQTRHKQQVEELSNKLEAERQEREKEREVGDCEIALLTKQLEKAHQELRKSTATTQHSRGRSGSYKRDERDSSQVASLSGLPNLGNTCYINSIIQCLYSINTLRDYLTHDEFRKYINSKSEQKGKVVLAVAQVFKALSSGAVKDIFKKINSLKNVIEDLDEEFRGSHQHDAHDLLAGLLTWLHNDLVKLNDSSSIISKLFNIEHESVITCDKNKQVICCTKEVFSNLTLSVSEGNAQLLQDLLNKHYAQRKISWDCHFCGQEHLCNHDMKIVHLPPVLFIHLSRYSSQGPKGKKTQVLFPAEDLSLKEHMKLGSTSPCYEVCSVVRHKGTMTAGHYTAYCRSHRNGSDGWHFFDDDLVSSTDLDTILQLATAHILVYTQMK